MNSFYKSVEFDSLYDSIDIQITKEIQLKQYSSIKFRDLIKNTYHGDSLKGLAHGEYRYINITNLSNEGVIYFEEDKFVNTSAENTAIIRPTDIGNLLVSRSRNPGVFTRITEHEVGKAFGSFIIKIELKEEHKKHSEFLVMYLNSPIVQEYVKSKVSGGVGGNINQGVIKGIPIIYPDTIIEKLGYIDAVKEKMNHIKSVIDSITDEKNQNTLFRIVDKVFKDELGINYPHYALDRYNQINNGETKIIYNPFDNMNDELDYIYNTPFNISSEIKQKFEWLYLRDMLEQKISTGAYGKKIDEITGYCRIMVKNLSSEDENMKTDDIDNISEADFKSTSEVNHLKYGDILFSGSGAGGLGNMVINLTHLKGIIDSHVGIIRLKETVHQLFMYYFLTSYLGQQQILRCVTGTTGQISINLNKLKKIVVPTMSRERMEEIIKKINEEKQHSNIYDVKLQRLYQVIESSLDSFVINGYSDDLFIVTEEVMM